MSTRIDLHQSWQRMWQGLGACGDGWRTYQSLLASYSEPQRQYHCLTHLIECLEWFEQVQSLAQQPAAIESALWFHDAIYLAERSDNEAQSALWAKKALLAAGVVPPAAQQVASLVLATKHTTPPTSADQQLMVDIDLAILGASEARFAAYEQQIRAEYRFVPAAVFSAKRRAILKTFLARPRLYHTEYFYTILEAAARSNLLRAIAALES
ncbi:MAG: HD domain-containing protein [Almyronema sp.]